MAESHLQLNADGTTATRKTTLWPSSKPLQQEIIKSIFEQQNWHVTSISNINGSHRKLIPLHEIYRNLHSMANLNRIKIVLFEQNKTGKWLADQLGKSPCTVSKWCQNTIQPDVPTLDKISKLLDVSIKDLLVDNR